MKQVLALYNTIIGRNRRLVVTLRRKVAQNEENREFCAIEWVSLSLSVMWLRVLKPLQPLDFKPLPVLPADERVRLGDIADCQLLSVPVEFCLGEPVGDDS